MSNYKARFTQWLTANSIYFQVLNWIFVGGASVTIAAVSCQINREKSFIDIAKANPTLTVKRTQMRNPQTKLFEDDIITVENVGESARNVKLDEKSILIASINGKSAPTEVQLFIAQLYNQATKGTLFTLAMPGNNSALAKLDQRLRAYNQNMDPKHYISYKIKTILHISYINILGEEHSKCWVSEGVFKNYESSVDECLKAKQQYKNLVPVEISLVTPEMIASTVNSYKEGE